MVILKKKQTKIAAKQPYLSLLDQGKAPLGKAGLCVLQLPTDEERAGRYDALPGMSNIDARADSMRMVQDMAALGRFAYHVLHRDGALAVFLARGALQDNYLVELITVGSYLYDSSLFSGVTFVGGYCIVLWKNRKDLRRQFFEDVIAAYETPDHLQYVLKAFEKNDFLVYDPMCKASIKAAALQAGMVYVDGAGKKFQN